MDLDNKLLTKNNKLQVEKNNNSQLVTTQVDNDFIIKNRNIIPTVYLVGTGMGSMENYTSEALNAIRESQIIIGAERMIKSAQVICDKSYKNNAGHNEINDNKNVYTSYKPDEIKSILDTNTFSKAAVLLSGDSSFYSGAKKLTDILTSYDVRCIAGISSISYFCSKIGKAYDDAAITSCHGRHVNLIQRIFKNRKTFALLDGQQAIHTLCEKLIYYNMEHVQLYIGENLSYENERIFTGTPYELKDINTGKLVVLLAENYKAQNKICHNIPDEEFIRGKVPMTKSAVRAVSIAKMDLKSNSIVYDIGAGTGSVSVEIAVQSPDIHVYAIEKNPAAIELITENKRKFAADNIDIINAYAPEGLDKLTPPDRVFIGGSTGNILSIIETVFAKNPECIIVINTVTLNTITEIMNVLDKNNNYKADITQINAANSYNAGKYMLMKAENPIYIIKLRFVENGV